MLGGAVQLCTARPAKVANLSGLLFQFLFDFRQVRQDALLHFPSDAAANKAAEETAQTVGSAAIDSGILWLHLTFV